MRERWGKERKDGERVGEKGKSRKDGERVGKMWKDGKDGERWYFSIQQLIN